MTGEGFDAEAIEGEDGQFDVLADGRLIFSKRESGRFPDESEVVASLRA